MHSFIKGILALTFIIIISTSAYAAPYGHYDLNKIPLTTETKSGKKYQMDPGYLDQIFLDIYRHSFTPLLPNFDSPQDKSRAFHGVQGLIALLNIYIDSSPAPDFQMLGRAALVNHMGYNMGLSDAKKTAEKLYKQMLEIKPDDDHANFFYGLFLLNSCQREKSIEHLKKSVKAGNHSAPLVLASVYVITEDNQQALNTLDNYLKNNPNDSAAKKCAITLHQGKLM
ncbi:tetratricopeptide repeat protein [Phytobacter sp. V91]|uniref:tetratricopeptide repeat protein n=1 Tax=Phytobacter sp. V91 TaxID=3369425 RepID=UPI003F635B86